MQLHVPRVVPTRRVVRRLGIEVHSKGFAFIVLEDTERLIDWGGCMVKGHTPVFLERLARTIRRYRPDVLVLEDPAGSRKGQRARDWLVWGEQYAHDHELRAVAIHHSRFRPYLLSCGEGKYDLARALARRFPELAERLPSPRQAWESEKSQVFVFVALGRTCFAAEGEPML